MFPRFVFFFSSFSLPFYRFISLYVDRPLAIDFSTCSNMHLSCNLSYSLSLHESLTRRSSLFFLLFFFFFSMIKKIIASLYSSHLTQKCIHHAIFHISPISYQHPHEIFFSSGSSAVQVLRSCLGAGWFILPPKISLFWGLTHRFFFFDCYVFSFTKENWGIFLLIFLRSAYFDLERHFTINKEYISHLQITSYDDHTPIVTNFLLHLSF